MFTISILDNVVLLYYDKTGGDCMIQTKNAEVKFRGSDKDLAIDCISILKFLYQTRPDVFHEVIDTLIKEAEYGTTVHAGPEAD